MNNLIKKGVVVAVILLFVSVSVIPSTGTIDSKQITMPTTKGDTLYVGGSGPNNYTKIQDAIDNASDGDTVLVFSGTYNEWIRIHKQLFIKGIKKPGENIPIINGGDDHDTVIIYADGCSFEDFKVRNGPAGFLEKGITLHSDNNVITNCEVFNTGTGLYLDSSCNNSISNNHMHGGHKGFDIQSSCNNTFFNNLLYTHNNFEVKFSKKSKNNLFWNNTAIKCGASEGVELENSDDNIILGNNISYNYQGLVITSSKNITVCDNVFWGNGIIITGTIEQKTSHTIENNLANGKPIYFYKNMNGGTVPTDGGQVILLNCTDFTIRNLNISSVNIGIDLDYSSHNTIVENTISSTYSIRLANSDDNNISENIISGSKNGISLTSSSNNMISWNTIKNRFYGIFLSKSSNSTISDNTVVDSRVGINLESSNDNVVSRNNLSFNELRGMSIKGKHNIISDNRVYASEGSGIEINGFYATVYGNTISESKGVGLMIDNGFRCVISRNEILKNRDGLYLIGFGMNLIKENNLILNKVYFFMSLGNRWTRNYWGGPRVLPKLIFGGFIIPGGYGKVIPIPWVNFDLRPALVPYDIGVG